MAIENESSQQGGSESYTRYGGFFSETIAGLAIRGAACVSKPEEVIESPLLNDLSEAPVLIDNGDPSFDF